MVSIVPYIDGIIESDGAVVFPNNQVKLINDSHNEYSYRYILGKDYDYLKSLCDSVTIYDDEYRKLKIKEKEAKSKVERDYYAFMSSILQNEASERFNDYVKKHNLSWRSIDDIDPYISSPLSENEKILLNKWLETRHGKDAYSDFLLQVLGIDKIHTITSLYIFTTSSCPYIKYFNYYLMGFEISEQYPMKYNEVSGKFAFYDEDCLSFLKEKNLQYKEDASELRSKILIKDRHLFFRSR